MANERLDKFRKLADENAKALELKLPRLDEVVEFWTLLDDEKFLKLFLDSDLLGRQQIMLKLSDGYRMDKPSSKLVETVLLKVTQDSTRIISEIVCRADFNTMNRGVMKFVPFLDNETMAKSWAVTAFHPEYNVRRVEKGNPIGYQIFIEREMKSPESLSASHGNSVEEWFERIEEFLNAPKES